MADGLLIRIGADASQAIAAIKQTGAAVANFGKQVSSQVGSAFSNFGSTVSKAFGSIKSAASTAMSIGKELFASFITPTAIIGGISALAVAIYDWATAESAAEKAQRTLTKAMDDGKASVQGEIANIQSLVAIAKDESLSRDVRLQAMGKLNKEYPTTFGNLELDGTLTDKLTKKEKELTAELIRQAQVKANIKIIDEASQRIAEARRDPGAQLGFWGQLKLAVTSFGNASIGAGNAVTAQFESVDKIVKESELDIAGASKALKELNTESAKAKTLFVPPTEKTKVTKEVKVKTEKEKIIIPVEVKFDQSRYTAEADIAALNISKVFKNIGAAVQHFGLAGIKQELTEQAAALISAFERVQANIANTRDLLVGGLAPAFEQVFNGIGKGGANAFQLLGQAVKQIITKLIAAAATAAVVAAIMSSFGAGTFKGGFKNIFGSLSGFQFAAAGGVTQGPVIAGEAGQEAIIPLNQLPRILSMLPGGGGSSNITVTGVIRGADIHLSNKRASGQLGGTFS